MEIYSSEEEQADVIRRFFRENGKAMVIGLVIGFAALLSWKYWQNHRSESLTKVSTQYEEITGELQASKPDGVAKAEKFIQGDANNYGIFASLQLAHHFVQKGEYSKAAEQLQIASKYAKEENLQSLVVLRLARVQLQDKKLDDALKTLAAVKGDGWSGLADDLRGDILFSKGDMAGAREAYKQGTESNASQALQALMQMKLNNISS